MVGSHGLGKLSNVNAHHDEVLPDLPLLKVTPEGFLQGPEALLPADTRHQVGTRLTLSVNATSVKGQGQTHRCQTHSSHTYFCFRRMWAVARLLQASAF